MATDIAGIWSTAEAEEAAKYGSEPGLIKVETIEKDGDRRCSSLWNRRPYGARPLLNPRLGTRFHQQLHLQRL